MAVKKSEHRRGRVVPQRLGFLSGEIVVPEDFDRMGAAEIEALFGSDPHVDWEY